MFTDFVEGATYVADGYLAIITAIVFLVEIFWCLYEILTKEEGEEGGKEEQKEEEKEKEKEEGKEEGKEELKEEQKEEEMEDGTQDSTKDTKIQIES